MSAGLVLADPPRRPAAPESERLQARSFIDQAAATADAVPTVISSPTARKIAVIAPVTPFRGGIARHSTAMATALAERGDCLVSTESFARLYPAWLYPGASDRDPAAMAAAPISPRFRLDTLNPLTWLKCAARVAADCDVAVIPAWTFVVAPMLGAIARRLRRRGVRVVMIVHNAADHEAAGWKARLMRWQLAAADAFVTHTDALAAELGAAGHGQPVTVVPHPAYSDLPVPTGALPRERALELLCFGLVRDYKGVDIAMRALARSGLTDVRLTIAGEIWEGREAILQLAQSPELTGKVELIDRYVTDQEASELFARSDAVLAPYRSVTGSGVLAMARHCRRPVVASDLPGLAGIVRHRETGWLFPAGDEAALADLLRDQVTRDKAAAMHGAIARETGDDEWETYAAAVLNSAGSSGKTSDRSRDFRGLSE